MTNHRFKAISLSLLLSINVAMAACNNPPRPKDPNEAKPADRTLAQDIDRQHKAFKEEIKEPACKVDAAARAIVNKGKEELGVTPEQRKTQKDAQQPTAARSCPQK